MGLDEDMDRAVNNIGYYLAIGWGRLTPYLEKVNMFYNNVLRLFKTDLYIFFPGQDVPFSLKNVKKISDNGYKMTFYDISKRKFYEYGDKKCKNLPYLSAVVKFKDVEICDLTEWISQVKYSTEEIPNIRMLAMAWTLESGALLNISKEYYAEIIDDNGDTVRVDFVIPK